MTKKIIIAVAGMCCVLMLGDVANSNKNMLTEVSTTDKNIVETEIITNTETENTVITETEIVEETIFETTAKENIEVNASDNDINSTESVSAMPKAIESETAESQNNKAEIPEPETITQPTEPQGGSVNEYGQVYVPGFGWMTSQGPGEVHIDYNMRMNGNKVGIM